MTGPARLRDVAERAGVSIRTVSNVVNGYAPVSEKKRKLVEDAVSELGYRPNVLARNLKNGRSGLIALVVPELDVPYFSELARAVIAQAREHGYTVVVDQTDGEPERERELILNEGRAALFDGVIFSALALSQRDLPAYDAAHPIVLLGERVADGEHDHIGVDNVAASRAATDHLFDIGRRRIAAIGDQPYETGETAQVRTRGYELAHEARGVPLDRSLIVPTRNFHFRDGADGMARLLQHPDGPPDAVFCYNDLLAIGAIRALLSRGIRVPEDIAVAGFDDIEAGRYLTPSLTTIAPDRTAIAELAVERLLARLNGDAEAEPSDYTADFALKVRESTVGADEAAPSS